MAADASELRIEVHSRGELVAERPVSTATCVEDALFRGVVTGRIANDGAPPAFELRAEHDSASAVTAVVLSHPALPPRRYPSRVFAAQARHAIAALVADGTLANGSRVEWRLTARVRANGPTARVARVPFALVPCVLPRQRGALGVQVDARVLRAIQLRVAQAGTVECAGLLFGSLLHDAARRRALVRISDEVALAPGTRGASEVHFALDPASLLAARREAARRDDRLLATGWWHSHTPCASCFDQPRCDADTVFFSAHDVEVHESAFPSAYAVALVVGKVRHLPARRPGFRLFGWRRARVRRRRFEVVGASAELLREEIGERREVRT